MSAPEQASTPLADKVGALQSRRSTAAFLRDHAPYDAIAEELLVEALQGARLSYFASGQVLLRPEDGVPDHFCVVLQGSVRGLRAEPDGTAARIFEAGPGETFLNTALQENRPTRTVHEAAQDSFILQIPRAGFDRLLEASEAFAEYCERRASVLIDQARHAWKLDSSGQATGGLSLDSTLQELVKGEPVMCSAQLQVGEAVALMHQERVGSIVVADEAQRPLGIFTLHDLRALVAEGGSLTQPLGQVMTQQPVCLEQDRPGFEAAMAMVDHQVGHVPVTAAGKLIGVVSQRDLFALQRVDAVQLMHEIQRSSEPARLTDLQRRVQDLVHAMLAHGASTRQLTRLITRINDAVVQRVVSLARDEVGAKLPAFTWLAFGSEARGEQTFSTDQDNGLLFRNQPGLDDEQSRAIFLPVARRINALLDQVGFPLCRGQVMGGNPELCLSAAEWQAKFDHIIRESSPENLLRATILFDSRVVSGPAEELIALRGNIARQAAHNTRFQHALAQHALEWRPPLGVFRSFVTEETEQGRGLDLKKSGLQIFVSGARVLALAVGIDANNTEDRLMAVAASGKIEERDARAWCEAFAFIQQLRMRGHQRQLAAAQPLSNQLDPDALNPLDRRILKEALRQARRLQTRLKLDYP